MSRTKSIIAVFGSNDRDTLSEAESLGRVIVEMGSVLLTGGGKDLNAATVKDRAMRGARSAEQAGHPAQRVGVLGKEATQPAFTRQDLTSLVFLSLAYGDRRNYVEACMSDAVVAFQGGAGTKSEVAFALSLGRPVVLVGERWQREFPAVRSRDAFEEFLRLAKGRAEAEGEETIDTLISAAYNKGLSWDADYAVTWLPLGSDAQTVAADVRAAAQGHRLPGRLPLLPERREVCAAYEQWLDQIEQQD